MRPGVRPRGVRALAAAALVWIAACGDGEPDVMGPGPVSVPNRPPEAVGTIPARTLPVGDTATVDVSPHFRDPDGDALSYTVASSNAEVVGVSVSGSAVTVTAVARGIGTITVTARDPQGLLAQQLFEVTVPNQAPAAGDTIPARTLFTGETATVDASAHFHDPDGDALTFTATSSSPGVATVTVSEATLTIRAIAAGAATVTVTASDPDGAGAEQRFEVTVPNREPEAVGALPPRTLAVDETEPVVVSPFFRDPDGDALAYEAASSDTAVAAVAVSGDTVSVTALAKGVATITVTARDGQGLAAEQRFEVTVPNRAPAAADTIPAQTLFTGETATVDASAHFRDPDGDPLTFTATSSSPEVATVTVSEATLTIRAVAAGVATISVTASDPDGAGAEQRFEVTVPNRAPEAVGTLPPRTLAAGETEPVVVSAFFQDPDGDSLTFMAASSSPEVATVSVAGDTVALTALVKGVATITVTAHDGEGLAAEQRFEVAVPNRAPEVVGPIPSRTLPEGEAATVDVSAHFRDPDGDPLTYTAASSNPDIVLVVVSEATLTIGGLAPGVALVTVTARDPEGAHAASSFEVTVVRTEDPFEIDLVFATSMNRAQEAAFQRAAERWMEILAPTDLPDVRLNQTLGCGPDPRFERYVETIDDLMIVVAVTEIDGPRGTLGRAGPCAIRISNSLPVYGRIQLDAADLDRLETRDLEEVILHEMGHVLGIGLLWPYLDLLRNPASATSSPDTHFTGPLAIAAFDDAGGAGYRSAKVPVENTGGQGSRNSHWRESVLALEVMTPYQHLGVAEPMSAITIQSLADLGYEVDATLAEPYRLPSADMARAIEAAPGIPYGDDIWRGPLVVVDPTGRIVRVIPR